MIDFATLARTGRPLIVPGAHDALSARMIEEAGFSAYGIGGSALAATQLALPDAGLQSFGEYRDAVGRIMEGAALPVMIDGENGFGDVKAVVRTVRSFERLGASAIAFEDLTLPVRLGRPPAIDPHALIDAKLRAALDARTNDDFAIIGRTDACYTAGLDDALKRAAGYADLGVDGVIVPGLPDLDAYKRLRDRVSVPILAVVVQGSPWFAPSLDELARAGIEAAIYPATVLAHLIAASRHALQALREGNGAPPAGFDMRSIAATVRIADWIAIDEEHA